MNRGPLLELVDRFSIVPFQCISRSYTSSEAPNRLHTRSRSLSFCIPVLAAYYGLTYLKLKIKMNATEQPPILTEVTVFP